MTLLDVLHVQKIYQTRFGGTKVTALSDIHFTVEAGEYVAIMGESGSGKTTLLNILATLDRPSQGIVKLNGVEIQSIPEKALSAFRRDHLGFVFQDFNLLDTLSVKDNILLPLVLAQTPYKEMQERLRTLASLLGISRLLENFPYELSGGQQQRVAIGRALITEPTLLLADEPTGSLDSKSSSKILDLFDAINERGQTVLMVTHSITAASRAKRVLFIKDGVLYNQVFRGERTYQEMFELISETLTVMAGRGELNDQINQ
ncbi:ABC transporter ATP-binding protein [Granulicatella seriolae]|uniref:ABC transporter ATP-binding protein n=1 Tax=Granulicatella seriolae TaxID=2967226 RepID=A0ABT1WME8_9LACT|nr:ABC transporter ATP-binding protein [Granulicatella seriolae]